MNIRTFQQKLDWGHNQLTAQYPGFDKPTVVPAGTVRGMAPMYLRRKIDDDKTAYYMFIKGNPLSGDVSRTEAVNYLYDLLHNKIKVQSSLESKFPCHTEELYKQNIINRELLPAETDTDFQSYYEEQMELLYQKMEEERREQERLARNERLGFDPDDPESDVIDIDDDGNVLGIGNPSSTRSVQQAASTAVDMPQMIWYAIDLHLTASGNELGHDQGGRLNNSRRRHLREEDSEITDKKEEVKDDKVTDKKEEDVKDKEQLSESFSTETLRFWNRIIRG